MLAQDLAHEPPNISAKTAVYGGMGVLQHVDRRAHEQRRQGKRASVCSKGATIYRKDCPSEMPLDAKKRIGTERYRSEKLERFDRTANSIGRGKASGIL
eukprot:6457057-Amphidinium_carterae.2